MTNKFTLRYTGGLVPDVCQQFTKGQGVFTNPTSKAGCVWPKSRVLLVRGHAASSGLTTGKVQEVCYLYYTYRLDQKEQLQNSPYYGARRLS